MRHLLIPLLAIATMAAEDSPTTFTQVKSILDTSCVNCHGQKKSKGKLQLDTVEGVLRGGKKLGPGVVAGKPDESPLVKVLLMDPKKDKMAMPPEDQGDPLTKEQIARIRKWITDGAKP